MDEPAPKRTRRLQVMLSPEELQDVEDWRFAHRMPTLASAVRELIRRGMAGNTAPARREPAGGAQRRRQP